MRVTVLDRDFEVSLPETVIRARVKQLGEQLSEAYHNENPLFVILLKGSFIFAADLIREFKGPCELAFVRISSWATTASTGNVQIHFDAGMSFANRHIIIVEDIVDTGQTIRKYLEHMDTAGKEGLPASVKVMCLLFKPDAVRHAYLPDYIGFSVPDEFLLGYGLDYNQQGRNLKDIFRLVPLND